MKNPSLTGMVRVMLSINQRDTVSDGFIYICDELITKVFAIAHSGLAKMIVINKQI